MPPKPTCKVVKREGQSGARIDPKGCVVRTTKTTGGVKTMTTKSGAKKIKMKSTTDTVNLVVSGRSKSALWRRNYDETWGPARRRAYQDKGGAQPNARAIVYDTGATRTLMTKELLRDIGENPDRQNNVGTTPIRVADGSVHQLKVLNNITYYVHTGEGKGQGWHKVRENVVVGDMALLGTGAMKQMKRLRVKFK